jgi:hypothetical protein
MVRLQILTGVLIVLVLAADLVYAGIAKKQDLVSWTDLILIAFVVFVIFIDQIYKFTIGAKGMVFERRVTAVARLRTATGRQKLAELDAVLEDFSGKEKDIWMILYRISLRALLRKACSEKNALELRETTSIVEMVDALVRAEVITEEFADQLEHIRNTTFFFEWGTGSAPSEVAIRKVESNAPRALKKLAKI